MPCFDSAIHFFLLMAEYAAWCCSWLRIWGKMGSRPKWQWLLLNVNYRGRRQRQGAKPRSLFRGHPGWREHTQGCTVLQQITWRLHPLPRNAAGYYDYTFLHWGCVCAYNHPPISHRQYRERENSITPYHTAHMRQEKMFSNYYITFNIISTFNI